MPSIPQMFNLAAADGQAEDLDLDGVESASQGVRSIQGHSTAAAAATSAPSWRCAVCGGPSLHGTVDGNWTCSDCGSLDYYRVNEQTWRHTSFGTWIFSQRDKRRHLPGFVQLRLIPRAAPQTTFDCTLFGNDRRGRQSSETQTPTMTAWTSRT